MYVLDLPLYSYDYRKCVFVDFFIEYINTLNCVHY